MPNSCAASCHSLKVDSFGLGLDPDIAAWNEAHDVELAMKLEEYFGPGGHWWNTEHVESVTRRSLEAALPPGSFEPAPVDISD